MERNVIINDLNIIFEDIIDEGKVSLSDSTTSKDIDSWDSLTNIQLIVHIEKKYNSPIKVRHRQDPSLPLNNDA